MSKNINIPLTDAMREFIMEQTGEGTLYATPTEYVRDLIRHAHAKKMDDMFRSRLSQGFADMDGGRTSRFSGDLLKDISD